MALDSNLSRSRGNHRSTHTHTHTHLEQNRNLLSLHHATFRVSRARHICTRAGYLTSTGKRPEWRRKRRSIALHASSLSVAGKRDGRGTAARHGSLGCQEMTIYRQHSMAVSATISTLQGSHLSAEGCFFSPPPSVWSLSTEKESIKYRSTWVTFLISSSHGGAIQRSMTAGEQSLLVTQLQRMLHFDNIQIIKLPQHISNFPFWSNTEKKNQQ